MIHAGATAAYVAAIASFLFYVSKTFKPEGPDTALAPMAMLLLLVFSAAVTGSLIFGRPILWYLDGKKRDALSLLIYILGFLFAIMVIAFLALYLVQK